MSIDIDTLYEEYINDVTKRCINAIKYEKRLFEELKSLPLDELKERAKNIIITNNQYRRLNKITPNTENNVGVFENEVIPRAYRSMFGNSDKVEKLFQSFRKKNKQIDEERSITEEEKERRKQVVRQFYNLKTEELYNELPAQTKEECLKRFYASIISMKMTDEMVRDEVADILGTPIDTTIDRGNCTKAIIASLLKLEKKYDIKILKRLKEKNIESILHPTQLSESLSHYVKKSKTGYIKDIEEVKIGDIFLQFWEENKPTHAMMCYDFDINDEGQEIPLLLGFSCNTKDIDGFYYYDGTTPQRGFILDVKKLLKDAIKSKVKTKRYCKER